MDTNLTVLLNATHQAGVEIDGPTMIFPSDMTYEDWAEIDKQFDRAEMGIHWWRGDWYNAGEDRFDRYVQALEATPTKYRTIQNNGSVCRQYTKEERERTWRQLSFSHHALVAYLERPLRGRLLALAIRNNWSCADLRKQIDMLRERKEEAEHEEAYGGVVGGSNEYIPIDVPVTAMAVASLCADHLDLEDMEIVRDFLNEQMGVEKPGQEEEPAEPEEWNLEAARLMREAETLIALNVETPGPFQNTAALMINWLEQYEEEAVNAD